MDQLRNRNLMIGIMIALLFLGLGLDQLGYFAQVRVAAQTVSQPIQRFLSGMAETGSEAVERQQSIEQLQEEHALLREEANRLLVENVQLTELKQENDRLRELLNYTRNNPEFDYTTGSVLGRIIGSDPSNLLFTIVIDVGIIDGVAKDMPVVTQRGLAGRVVDVGPNAARVLLLIDPASSVNAVIQNSRVQGIVQGQLGELGGTLIMERIPQGETVSPGELVLTSGLGGKFPDKLVIGQVTEVFQRDLDLFQTALIRPTVDFSDLETVLVLTAFEPVDFEQELLDSVEDEN